MERIRNSVKVGEKRIKEPSSYAGTSTGPRTNTTYRSNDGLSSQQAQSLHHSFSNLSMQNSSRGTSLWGTKETSQTQTGPSILARDRADSNASRESETSAMDRFLSRFYEPRAIKLNAKVGVKHGNLEFIITLMVKDFGSKDWSVIRSVEEVVRFCELVRQSGAGMSFPMPPPAEEMLARAQKQTMSPPPVIPSGANQNLGPMESHESTSSLGSARKSIKHQKKRANPGPRDSVGTSGGGGMSLLRGLSQRLSFASKATPSTNTLPKKGTAGVTSGERVYPSVQEWFDAALEVWQRKWHSKSDEDGISIAFERFLCDPSGSTSAPIDLLTAVDFVVLVTASAPYMHPSLALNRKREGIIAKAALRLAKDYPEAITIDMLKGRVLAYAWERFEASHPMNVKELLSGQRFVVFSHEELAFLQLHIAQQVQPTINGPETRLTYLWQPHSQLSTLRMNLVENFSVPPTPRSLGHFFEVWRTFSDIVLLRVEARLRALGMGVPYNVWAAQQQQ